MGLKGKGLVSGMMGMMVLEGMVLGKEKSKSNLLIRVGVGNDGNDGVGRDGVGEREIKAT